MLREPDIAGSHGKAWKLKVKPPQDKTTLNAYVLSCYGAHAFWNWWVVSIIHLHDVEGMPAAVKNYPEATHEFLILTINPESCPPDPDNLEVAYLMPPDAALQFDGLTDEQAAKFVDEAVCAIVDGRISPDQDYRSAWEQAIAHWVLFTKEATFQE